MEFLQNLFENADWPILSAFLLGLMTAISPCPLATNITAIGFISRDINNKRQVFYKGLIYTLGRAFTYTAIGLIFYFGSSQIEISGFLKLWGEKILGPLMIIIGLFMIDLIKLPKVSLGGFTSKVEDKSGNGYFGALLLGIVFALAFCPYSGVLYFGMLIPMTITSVSGLYLPVVFALGTGLPVIIIAWLIAFSIGSVGSFYNKLKTFELWFRRVIAVLFIGIGIYYTLTVLFKLIIF